MKKELQEMDRIAKMLIRRDFELSIIREKREIELKELRDSRKALMSMLQDVKRERNKAEEERNKTLAIIHNFADGILVLDKDNNVLLINPKIEDLFNLKKEDIIGKSILKLSDIDSLKLLINFFKKKGKKVSRQELKIDEDLVLEMSVVPIVGKKVKLGTLIILHDVTREKLIEKMKSEFVSLAAHQLRTPLSAMKWTMKMILDEELGKITKEQKEFLEDSYQSNEKMISLINDLLNVTRIEEGRYLCDLILSDIVSIVQFVINSHGKEIKKKRIKIEFKKPAEEISKVMIDVEKIRMAIKNLVDNAIRYSLSDTKIIISLRNIKNTIEFSIKDNGVGIPQKQQSRIFDKFFRGANILKMDTEGTGLGLYITRNIIEAHGGKIWFESKEEQGSVFYFNLPV